MSVHRIRLSKIKGLSLVDARGMAERNPGTFAVPPTDELCKVGVGDFIKVCFEPKGGDGERIWLRVVGFYGGLLCRLANYPMTPGLDPAGVYLVMHWNVYEIKLRSQVACDDSRNG